MRMNRSILGGLVGCAALLLACAGQPLFTDLDEGTRKVLENFQEIAKVPRCSGNQAAIGKWLMDWGKGKGFKSESDRAGNVLMRVPATAGYENAPVIMLQSHMDMVGEKTPSSKHDFAKDPIVLIRDGEWLKADQTSLGADDGIGMALALSIAQDPQIPHPPLELIFTKDEETTGAGANNLAKTNLDGKVLINLDSEQEGLLVIGDASIAVGSLSLPLKSETLPGDFKVYTLRVAGLKGGHSGADITKPRGNALKVMARALETVQKRTDTRLISLNAGKTINAIPREAEAQLAFGGNSIDHILKDLQELQVSVQKEYTDESPGIEIQLKPADSARPKNAFQSDETTHLVTLLLVLPNGVATMDPRFPGVPETSNCLARARVSEFEVLLDSMQRGSNILKLKELNQRIGSIAIAAGASFSLDSGDAPWQADPNSGLLKRSQAAYARVFGTEPQVGAVHGGLECGVIARRGEGLDVISIGPTVLSPHSPEERVLLPSVKKVRDLLIAVLREYR